MGQPIPTSTSAGSRRDVGKWLSADDMTSVRPVTNRSFLSTTCQFINLHVRPSSYNILPVMVRMKPGIYLTGTNVPSPGANTPAPARDECLEALVLTGWGEANSRAEESQQVRSGGLVRGGARRATEGRVAEGRRRLARGLAHAGGGRRRAQVDGDSHLYGACATFGGPVRASVGGSFFPSIRQMMDGGTVSVSAGHALREMVLGGCTRGSTTKQREYIGTSPCKFVMRPGGNGRFPLGCSAGSTDRCAPARATRGDGNRSLPVSLSPSRQKTRVYPRLCRRRGAALLSSSLRPRAAALSLAVAEAAAAANPSPFRGKERTARRAEGGERRRDL
uniref:DUF1263 domain-containing protein n=1 Tax=Oryza sativa subsp. japonica TaxID=39947 RepID=Q84R61_ORYSJ|nr:hypothetical protein [Oryza sativa Japonica Group]AAR87196.1 hypothetical protein [Oryza sativa Japonica Group]